LITWVFQDDFIPRAKITKAGNYSIISDYLGTPVEAYDEEGKKVWERELDIYGRVKDRLKDKYGKTIDLVGEDCFIPFRYQGQYEDVETGLYYNRFRYYDPETGQYTQQDPIRLAGGMNLYAYVHNPNIWIDPFGLSRRGNQATRDHIEVIKDLFMHDNPTYDHVGGGLDKLGNKVKETYIRPSNPIPGSTKGGSYADLTFRSPKGEIVHINTVDKGNFISNGKNTGMTEREWVNANRIQADAPGSKVITVRKGDVPQSGDLKVEGNNTQKGQVICR